MTIRLTRRGFVGAAVAAPALAALPISLRGVAAQDGIVVTMVTDTAGLGDQNFNDLANAGGTQAAADLGIQWKVIESVDIPAYVPNLTAGAEQGPLVLVFIHHDALAGEVKMLMLLQLTEQIGGRSADAVAVAGGLQSAGDGDRQAVEACAIGGLVGGQRGGHAGLGGRDQARKEEGKHPGPGEQET